MQCYRQRHFCNRTSEPPPPPPSTTQTHAVHTSHHTSHHTPHTRDPLYRHTLTTHTAHARYATRNANATFTKQNSLTRGQTQTDTERQHNHKREPSKLLSCNQRENCTVNENQTCFSLSGPREICEVKSESRRKYWNGTQNPKGSRPSPTRRFRQQLTTNRLPFPSSFFDATVQALLLSLQFSNTNVHASNVDQTCLVTLNPGTPSSLPNFTLFWGSLVGTLFRRSQVCLPRACK